MVNYKIFHFNLLATACTVIWGDDKRCAISDPGCQDEAELSELTGFITREGLAPQAILLTHGHPDHICGVSALLQHYDIPVYLTEYEKEFLPVFQRYGKNIALDIDISFPTRPAADGMVLPVGEGLSLQVISTPGHSPGGVCYYDAEGEILIAGDTLFAGCIGRSDLHGGDYDTLIHNILERLIPLPGETLVIPGHGQTTTIGAERASNPFLEPFNISENITTFTN